MRLGLARLGSARLYSGLGSAHLDSVRGLAIGSIPLAPALVWGTVRAELVLISTDKLTSQSQDIHGPPF